MKRYTSFDPKVEVVGINVRSATRSIASESIRELVDKRFPYGVQPDQWYPLQDWLDVLSDISGRTDGLAVLMSIGTKAADTLNDVLELNGLSLEEKLNALNDILQSQHRGGDVGEITVVKKAETYYRIVCRVPYPDDMMYAIFHQATLRHQREKSFRLAYDFDTLRRDEGGETTVFLLKWSD
jgi:hypothetical protein